MRRRAAIAAALALTLAPTHAHAASGEITTLAGGGIDDGVPALRAQLGSPAAVAVSPTGDVVFADNALQRIRTVRPDGTIATIAGMGSDGPVTDGPALNARFGSIASLSYAADGSLVIADSGEVYPYREARIRRLDPSGIISTIAGGGALDPADGAAATAVSLDRPAAVHAAPDGSVYFAESQRVWRITSGGVLQHIAGTAYRGFWGDGGDARDAELDSPQGLCVIGEDLYIADGWNNRVRRVNAQGIITTVAGGGPNTETAGDGGPATSAYVSYPTSLVAEPGGTLLVLAGGRIRRFWAGGTISTVAGNRNTISSALEFYTGVTTISEEGGPAAEEDLGYAASIARADDGTIFVGFVAYDEYYGTRKIRRIDPARRVWTFAGSDNVRPYDGEGGPAASARLIGPSDVAVHPDGSVLFVEYDRIRRARLDGTIDTVIDNRSAVEPWPTISSVTIDAEGAIFWVDERGAENVYMYDGSSTSSMVGEYDGLRSMTDLAAGDGWIYVSTTSSIARFRKPEVPLLRVIDPIEIEWVAFRSGEGWCDEDLTPGDTRLYGPNAIAVDAAGMLLVSDCNRLLRIDPDTQQTTLLAGNGSPGFGGDGGPALDATLSSPAGLIAEADGSITFADQGNHRIRRIAESGIITTVAGSGTLGFSGDGGRAADAELYWPSDVTAAGDGALLFVDAGNDRLRRITR